MTASPTTITRAAVAAASGSSHAMGERRHHGGAIGSGGVRVTAARSARQRAQLAACDSIAARPASVIVPSAQAASESVSTHVGDSVLDASSRNASRSSRSGNSVIDDLLDIERTRILDHRSEARGDLRVAQPRLVAQLALDVAAELAARAGQMTR